ncbi:MAG: VanW family protein [Christensenellaceae bacterium]|nr:VanW family protein [Christensenellaceae bacterium]
MPPRPHDFVRSNYVYLTIIADGKKYDVTDETLRGGWWNAGAQKSFTNGKTLYERADDFNNTTSYKSAFPDIMRIIEKIKNDVEVKPYDGVIVFNAGEKDRFNVTGQQDGRDLDEEKLRMDILDALKTGQHKTIVACVKVAKPKTEAQMTANLGLRGGYTTYFEENPNREHNIELALSKFNGLAVQNGQSVSFNGVVGPRSATRGFQEAKIIMDGEFVPGIGGGVCQASTTLFNALLLAGLKIDKSHNHSLAISYVPIGRDAMVSSSADLRFTNDSGGTIYIETGVVTANSKRPGYCYVRIYGNKTRVKYKARTEVTEFDLRDGEIDPARKANTYIEAWSGDRLVHSKLVRKSNYKAAKED